MPHPTEQLIFKRNRWEAIIWQIGYIALTLFGLILPIYTFFFYHESDALQGKVVSAIALLFVPMFLSVLVYTGDIHIDDEGIGRWLWGKRVQYIRWSDVKTMTIATIVIRNWFPSFLTSYCLYTTEKRSWINSQLHDLRFDGKIPDIEKLAAIVTDNIRRYNAKIIDKRDRSSGNNWRHTGK
jgi:magnesium-transporting ATPase (P-type)